VGCHRVGKFRIPAWFGKGSGGDEESWSPSDTSGATGREPFGISLTQYSKVNSQRLPFFRKKPCE